MTVIEQQLNRFRKAILINDGGVLSWIAYALLLTILVNAILLESIFYFSQEIRFRVWQYGIIITMVIGLGVILLVWLAWKNRIRRYRWSTLARMTGELAFPKKDIVINALQLERNLGDYTSTQLSKDFIDKTVAQLQQIDEKELFPTQHRKSWKIYSIIVLSVTAVLIGFNWEISAGAVYRWTHPQTVFYVPQPFAIEAVSKNINLLGGETAELVFKAAGNVPDSLFIDLQASGSIDSLRIPQAALKDEDRHYRYTIEAISQNYRYRAYVRARKFWEAWSEISTPFYLISVTDRPVMEDLTITITPPPYTRLKPVVQKSNQANISGLAGSQVHIKLRSNRPLKNGELAFADHKIPLQISGKDAEGDFKLIADGPLSIQLEDTRGIANRNPIPFQITVIADLYPDITVLAPESNFELGRDQAILMQLQIEDDFGFSNLQVAYEVHRPVYIAADPLLSLFTIPIPDVYDHSQEIFHTWWLSELGLMPEDEVHFHFELADNDLISGPKKTVTSDFIARLPGLAELFTSFEDSEQNIMDEITRTQTEMETIRQNLNQMELEALKQDQLNWDQQQELQKMLESVQEEFEKMEELSVALETLQESAEKHDLFTSDVLDKFKHLQELIDEILTDELMMDVEKLNKMMDEIDPDQMQEALQSLTDNMAQIEEKLDRFIDIFERIKAEQKLDELQTRLETMIGQQEKIHEGIERTEDNPDPFTFSRLSEEEQRQVAEFSAIRDEMSETAEQVYAFHQFTANQLEEMKRDTLVSQTDSNLQNTVNQLRRRNTAEAEAYSASALDNMQQLLSKMESIQQEFQTATTGEMASKFQQVMGNVLNLSKSQEELGAETTSIPRNSPRLAVVANQQQMLQDQLEQIMNQLMALSRETFAVTPVMGRAMGMANAKMEESKNVLAQRNGSGSTLHQQGAMQALNELALAIHQAMNQMRSSGSASGYEQFLQQMQNMANQQQGINSQSMELALGQMAAAQQEALLQRLLQEQQQVRKSLRELMAEMHRSGKQGLGDLGGIASEMDEVLQDLELKKVEQNTVKRQQRILSRMLDSQRSMTQRGEKEERKSTTAVNLFPRSPDGLPADRGQRRSVVLDAMNRAMKAGYPRDYQLMIRRYFETISNSESMLIQEDSTVAN